MIAAWYRRSPRERRVLALGGAAAAALLLIALVWLPLERARTRLEREVPALRASLATLESRAQEARRLKASPAQPAGAAPATLAALAATGIAQVPGAQLTVLDERRLRLTGADVGFDRLLDWIAAAQASQGLRVDRARIEALAAPGRVRAELTLARS